MSEPSALPSPEQLRFVPYAQLVKMLVPSAGTVSIYGPGEELVWCSDGCERPDLHELLDRVRRESSRALRGAGLVEHAPGLSAYLTDLVDDDGACLGSLVVELTASAASRRRSVAPSLLRPVVDCLQARLRLEQDHAGSAHARGVEPFARLLDDDAPGDAAVIEQLLDGCVASIGVDVAVLIVPEANIEAVSARPAGDTALATAAPEYARARLLPWLELNDRPVVANGRDAGPGDEPKTLACPVRDMRGHVYGAVVLLRRAEGGDFGPDDTTLTENVARKISMLLNRRNDPLTGLLTRAAFERHAQNALDASPSSAALLYIDVDHLHQVNDAFGFDCGDRVLCFVAERIRALLAAGAVAGRLGGDRYAVMLPGTAVADARGTAEALQAVLAENDYVHLDQAIPVSVTVGIAAAPGRSVRHLIAAAELSAKRAKQRGPGRVALGRSPAEATLDRDREQLAYETFEDALATNSLYLEAQPIMGLASDPGRLLGFEIFVRMRGAGGEWLSAQRFLSAAEYYGMMPAIDRWVIGQTLDVLKSLAHDLPELPLGISVNVSTDSLKGGGYARYVLDALGRARVPSGLVSFELKEAAATDFRADVDRFVRTLGAAGSHVALDNFGSGTGAVAGLRSLSIKRIKIDGGLVRRCLDDPESAGLVQGLARAARGLGFATVAEQVESEPLATALAALGVDYAQGHHFGRPAPLTDWLARLRPLESDGNAALSP